MPAFCTTYHRAVLAGSCSISTGSVKAGNCANTCSMPSDTLDEGASPAKQEVLDGRESRPDTGGGFPGGGAESPPPHACRRASMKQPETWRAFMTRNVAWKQAISPVVANCCQMRES